MCRRPSFPPAEGRRPFLVLFGLGLVLEILFLAIGYAISTDIRHIRAFVALCLGAFLAYSGAVLFLSRIEPDRRHLVLILSFGVLFRLSLIPVEGNPVLPDGDAYRYLWDGRVTSAGLNPYRFSPADVDAFARGEMSAGWKPEDLEDLTRLRSLAQEPPFDDLFPRVEHRTVRTIYPPASQALFAAAAWVAPGRLAGIKTLLFLLEIGSLALLCDILRRLGRNPAAVLVYAWSPLVVEEFSYAGHHDALAVFFVVGAVDLLLAGRRAWAGAALGWAVMAKVYPLVLLPLFGRKGGRAFWVGVGVAMLLVALPFAGAGRGLLSGLGAYARGWTFNAGVFELIAAGSRFLGAADDLPARAAAAVAILTVSGWLAWRGRVEGETLLEGGLLALSVLLLLSPVLDPWYMTWIIPFLCVRPAFPLLYLSGVVFLHYLGFSSAVYRDSLPLRVFEFGSFYVVLSIWAWKRRQIRFKTRESGPSDRKPSNAP